MRVAIGYHFIAHYRAAVMESLMRDPALEVTFIADETEPGKTIQPWRRPDTARFLQSRCYQVGPLMLQPWLPWHLLVHRYDHVILLANAAWPTMWLAALTARARGARVHFWTHGWVKPESGIAARIRNIFYRLGHTLLLYGHYAKCIGVANGFTPERLHVIYNSLDAEAQQRLRSSVGPDELLELKRKLFPGRETLPLLICSSRLMKVRRLDMLLEAMHALRTRGLDLNLLLVGDGPEREPLSNQASALGLAVHFFGACYDEPMLGRLTMMSDLTVAPGKVGLTAMQSLGYGTPVLTHGDFADQMPEWEAIIPGKTGDLFANGDVVDLARAIERWFSSSPDREQVRAACYRMIDRFWNPANQHRLIKRALSGHPADDLDAALPLSAPVENT